MEKQKSRLMLEIPAEMHRHLKMQAAKKNIPMRDYVVEALITYEELTKKIPKVNSGKDMDEETFRKGFDKMKKERRKLAKALSDL
jgi:hypothetical protein